MKKILMIAIASILVLGSCGKYEEGPGFSLRSKKGRLAGEWQMFRQIVDGQDRALSADEKDDVWIIDKDGKYEITDPGNDSQKGSWTFGEDKETVTFTDDDNGLELKGTVLKLKNSELWMEFDFLGSTYLQQFK